MKYSTIKNRAKLEVCTEIGRSPLYNDKITALLSHSLVYRTGLEQTVEELMTMAETVIDNWDIRNLSKLRELFPGAFKGLPKGALRTEFTGTGWHVF